MVALGNRGKCAQPCRLPYELYEKESNLSNLQKIDNGYLLSPRDLCSLEYLPDLIEAGVTSFKIEGRMKSPEYVATVTRIYRKYIDLALSSGSYHILPEDKEELMLAFNRGGFSGGHLDNKPNRNLIDPQKPNNMGIYIGNVSHFNANKGLITLHLHSKSLAIGDTISLANEKNRYTVSELILQKQNKKEVTPGQTIQIGRMKGNIHIGDKIYLIGSKKLMIQNKESYAKQNNKIKLNGKLTVRKNAPICLTISPDPNPASWYQNITIHLESDVCPVPSINQPITVEKIQQQISKTTDTPFEFSKIEVDLEDNLYIQPMKALNELRRKGLEKLTEEISHRIQRSLPNDSISSFIHNAQDLLVNPNNKKSEIDKKISVLLNVLHLDYPYANMSHVDRIYIPLRYFANKKYAPVLKELSHLADLYIDMPTIILANYINLFINCIEPALANYPIKGFVLSNLSGAKVISMFQDRGYEFIAGYPLNVYNHLTAKELLAMGFRTITLSPELSKPHLAELATNLPDTELIVYGNLPIMTSHYCLLGKTNRCYPTCQSRCQNGKKYYLKDRLGFQFRILPDPVQTVTRILNSKITSISPKDIPSTSLRLDFYDETIEEINHVIEVAKAGERLEGQIYTNGNLNREV